VTVTVPSSTKSRSKQLTSIVTLTVRGGRTAIVRVSLNRATQRLLVARHILRVRITVRQGGKRTLLSRLLVLRTAS
jgi:hypothetical protein